MKDEPKRGPGRPPKLPPGPRHMLRCEVVGEELEAVRAAAAALGLSQQEFTRRAVLELAKRTRAATK
jgi:hypothetical protein